MDDWESARDGWLKTLLVLRHHKEMAEKHFEQRLKKRKVLDKNGNIQGGHFGGANFTGLNDKCLNECVSVKMVL